MGKVILVCTALMIMGCEGSDEPESPSSGATEGGGACGDAGMACDPGFQCREDPEGDHHCAQSQSGGLADPARSEAPDGGESAVAPGGSDSGSATSDGSSPGGPETPGNGGSSQGSPGTPSGDGSSQGTPSNGGSSQDSPGTPSSGGSSQGAPDSAGSAEAGTDATGGTMDNAGAGPDPCVAAPVAQGTVANGVADIAFHDEPAEVVLRHRHDPGQPRDGCIGYAQLTLRKAAGPGCALLMTFETQADRSGGLVLREAVLDADEACPDWAAEAHGQYRWNGEGSGHLSVSEPVPSESGARACFATTLRLSGTLVMEAAGQENLEVTLTDLVVSGTMVSNGLPDTICPCENPEHAGDQCQTCAGQRVAFPQCDQCPNPNFGGVNCDRCADLLAGPDCTEHAFMAVTAGGSHSCGLRPDGTVICWGQNTAHQTDAPPGSFEAISAGSRLTCGLRSDQSIECWGNDDEEPTPRPGGFQQVSTGGLYVCALRADGTIECWRGDEDLDSAPEGQFQWLSSGVFHDCGLRVDGTIACWGHNSHNQSRLPPGMFRTVSTGAFHTCGVRPDDTMECWGSNNRGQAVPVAGTFRTVAAGGSHSCAIRTDGTIACWGEDTTGESTPPPGQFRTLDAGGSHSCAVGVDHTITCWGENMSGQTTVPTP